MKGSFLALLVLLVGCSSMQHRYSDTADKDRLFPDGVYRHDVRLRSVDGKEFGFSGVVRLAPEKIAVVGLGPMRTTVFSVVENRSSGSIKAKIYQPAMAAHEDRLVAFLKALRVLLLQKSDAPGVSKVPGPDGTVQVIVEKRDEHGIPSQFRLEHEKFTVTVVVAGYET